MAEVYNWVWVNPLPPGPREVDIAVEEQNTIVVARFEKAVILYPSLMTPCLYLESTDDPWLELLIAAAPGALTEYQVNLQLKVAPSLSAKKHFHSEALFHGIGGNIEVAPADPDGQGLVRTHAKFAGVVHEAVLKRLKDAGLSQLYRVRVNYQALHNAADAKVSLPFAGQPEPNYPELQDKLMRAMLEERQLLPGYPRLPQLTRSAFRVTGDGVQLWDNPDTRKTAANPADPIQAYHPVYLYTSENPRHFNVGHLTDIHINSRLDVLQHSTARVVDTYGESPEIGTLVEPTNRNFRRLLKVMEGQKTMDILFIGGDLIDHQLNAYSRVAPKRGLTTIWDAVDVSPKAQKTGYVPGVDMVAFYSMMVDFCRSTKKPVVGVSGNHDCYFKPFGISPRAFGVKRANEGIPADVNLTFYEAALAFGPTWGDCEVPLNVKGDPASSFVKEWMEWFYTVFTPFTNFSSQLPKQHLVCLGWGNTEDMLLGGQGVGHLPRADEAMSDVQMMLMREASDKHEERATVVLQHFTVASFADDIPLVQNGEPATGALQDGDDEYNMGSFEEQHTAYIDLLGKRTISCVLTGHSHRRGVYLVGDKHAAAQPAGAPAGSRTLRVTLYDPTKLDLTKHPGKGRMPVIVVSDSGGPYPRLNRYGEFGGWGSDVPSGSVVTFDAQGKVAKVEVVRHQGQSRPRLAVAVDYADILLNSAWRKLQTDPIRASDESAMRRRKLAPDEVFYRLHLQLHEQLERIQLRIMRVVLHSAVEPATKLEIAVNGNASIALKGDSNRDFYDWIQRTEEANRFMSVKFESSNWNINSHYNMDHEWNFEVEISRSTSNASPNALRSYLIRRPERFMGGTWTFPEVPEFAWRRERDSGKKKGGSGA